MSEIMHFVVQGETITNMAREKLFVDKNLAGALRILNTAIIADDLTPDEKLTVCLQILEGDAYIDGNSDDGCVIKFRDDIDEHPTDLSVISQFIADITQENERLREENQIMAFKFSFVVDRMDDYQLSDINSAYYDENDEPMFQDMTIPEWKKEKNQPSGVMSDMLSSFLAQRKREEEMEENEEEPVCDYGWLEPNGTWHPVKWGYHSSWAKEYLDEHYPFKDCASLYWHVDDNGVRHHIVNGDVLIYSLGWILLDNPYQGLARVTRNTRKDMTKDQKDFLFTYYLERGRNEEANKLFED